MYSVYLWKMNVQYSTVFCNSYVCKKVDFRILFIKVRSEWTLIVSITFFSGLFTQQSPYQRKYFLEHAFECSEILVSFSQRVLTTNSLWCTNTHNIHFRGRAGSAGPAATGCRPLYIHTYTNLCSVNHPHHNSGKHTNNCSGKKFLAPCSFVDEREGGRDEIEIGNVVFNSSQLQVFWLSVAGIRPTAGVRPLVGVRPAADVRPVAGVRPAAGVR